MTNPHVDVMCPFRSRRCSRKDRGFRLVPILRTKRIELGPAGSLQNKKTVNDWKPARA